MRQKRNSLDPVVNICYPVQPITPRMIKQLTSQTVDDLTEPYRTKLAIHTADTRYSNDTLLDMRCPTSRMWKETAFENALTCILKARQIWSFCSPAACIYNQFMRSNASNHSKNNANIADTFFAPEIHTSSLAPVMVPQKANHRPYAGHFVRRCFSDLRLPCS